MSASRFLPLPRPSRAIPVLAFACLASAPLQAGGTNGVTERVSFAGDGSQVTENTSDPAISGDGRYVAYVTDEPLLPGDLNGDLDVYVYDREEGDLVCASTTAGGVFGNGESKSPSISEDGEHIAFETQATNLVGFDNNGSPDVLVKNLLTGFIERASTVPGSLFPGSGASVRPSISDTGRFVAFQSAASNLVPGDTNGAWDIFVADLKANTLVRASQGLFAEPNASSYRPTISADGNMVCFYSNASNLVLGDLNGFSDVFVRDLAAGTNTLISKSMGGTSANGDSYEASISSDGLRVLFVSAADDIVMADVNGATDVFAASTASSKIELVSGSMGGTTGNNSSQQAHLSRDGSHAVFRSVASNLTPISSVFPDVYIRDLDANQTWLVSRPTGVVGVADLQSDMPNVNRDGSLVAFMSDATVFDPADTNNVTDIYVRSVLDDPEAYCTSTPTSDGCLPTISSIGVPSASAPSGFKVVASDVPPGKTSLLFYGLTGRESKPFLGGTLCVQPPKYRTRLTTSSAGVAGSCDGTLGFDMNAFNSGALGGNPKPGLGMVGQQVNAQFWGRDPGAGPYHVFLSDAIEYFVGP